MDLVSFDDQPATNRLNNVAAQNLFRLQRANKVTIADVARMAGVSTATVDRVVNFRNGVKSRPVERKPR
jgi:hypothetical protein